ncbi:MAG: hypothetical protein K6G40_05340 [Eubacterium sp.]|nr:hypothetical protein [Eubacterium sp.]
MKKRIIMVSVLACAILIISGSIVYGQRYNKNLVEWGKDMASVASEDDGTEVKAGVITRQELQVATSYYVQMGYEENEALDAAKEYLLKREALYMEAVSNGYSASDEEVWEYLDELKETVKNADNSADVYAVIEQFDSEEDFWNYEFIVYKKDLPAQNYVSDMENSYGDTASNKDLTENQSDTTWETYFENLKDELQEKYEDKIVFE